jgi:hypothetical protein
MDPSKGLVNPPKSEDLMSDRSSPEIFYLIYTLLAVNPTAEHREIAAKLWKLSQQFDFSDHDLGCEEAMIALGIAEGEGENMKFGPEGMRR